MDIRLLHNSRIEGTALAELLREKGYVVRFDPNFTYDLDRLLPKENIPILLIDTGFISSLNRTEIEILLESKKRIILLGELTDLHRFFALSCRLKGFIYKREKASNLFSSIEKLQDSEVFVSPNIIAFFKNMPLEQQQTLFKTNLRRHLTKTELKVLFEVGRNKTTEEIAVQWYRSSHTINNHRKNAMRKLQLNGNSTLIGFCIQKRDALKTLIEIDTNKKWITNLIRNNR